MAKILPTLACHLLIISSLLSSISMILVSADDHDHEYVKSLDPELLGINKEFEKLTHFRFYWHDMVYSPNPSSETIVEPPSIVSQIRFGLVRMFDNALTETPDPSSKVIARAQGFYGSASHEELSLLMVENFAFVEGKYKGSAITVMGKNSIFNKERELSVIGGSGLFRFARGYAILRTHSFIPFENDNAIVEYNIYVLHY